jgi:hypothetical protein
MKFRLNHSGSFYNEKDKTKLEKYGFKFCLAGKWHPVGQEWTSDYQNAGEVYVEINTLEELLQFVSDCGSQIILSDDTIEIYDNYRE